MNPTHHHAHAALKANPNNMDAADFLLAAVKSECAAKQAALSALAAAEQRADRWRKLATEAVTHIASPEWITRLNAEAGKP